MPWRGVKYFRSKEALLRVCGSLNLLADEYNRHIIEALPDNITDVAKK
jgi:hypothetical protein